MARIIRILGLVLISVLLSCSGKTKGKRQDDPSVAVTVTEAKAVKTAVYVSYPGNIVALREVELRGQVGGYITGIYFKEGSRVRSGQMLYEIDRRKYNAAYAEAQSNVSIAEDNLEKVQRDVNRYTDLAGQDAVAKQVYDNAMTDLKNAKQQVDAANSELIKSRTDYEYSLITAPFSGTIGFSNVKMGALVTPGQTLLNTVSSDDSLGVDLLVSETELNHFRAIGMTGTKNDSIFQVQLPDNSIYPFPGRISVIDRAVDPQTGSLRIRITIPNRDQTLKPGMSCKVKVLNETGQRIVVPFKAVMEQLSEYFLFTVKDNKVTQTRVIIGPRVKSDVIILSGLAEGQIVVVDGIQKLHDGSMVKIISSQNEPGGNSGGSNHK